MIKKQVSKLISIVVGLIVVITMLTAFVGQPQAAPELDSIHSVQADYYVYLPVSLNNYVDLGIPIYGVQMYGNTSDTSPYHASLIDTDASWLRVTLEWDNIEPESHVPAVYNWVSADNILAAAREDMGGVNIIATIAVAPTWVTANQHGPIPAEFMDEYANFIDALVERYDGDGLADAPDSSVVHYWEFYNEPDNNSSQEPYGWGDDGDKYAAMLQMIYPVVKSANSQAKVVVGGLAYDWFEDQGGPFVRDFLTDVLDAGGGQYFDVMNFHYYPGFASRWTTSSGPGLKEKTEYIQNVLDQYSLDKPIFITETGWHDNNDTSQASSPEIQARYVVELYTQSLATDVKASIWWMLYDAQGGWPYDTGLVTNISEINPPSKKTPAFETLQRMMTELNTAVFERTLPLSETGHSDLEVHHFNDVVNNTEIYVAWLNPIDTTVTQSLRLSGSSATVLDSITGNMTTRTDSQDGVTDNKITIQVGSNPVYVEID